MKALAQLMKQFFRSDSGPVATEYAVLLAVIALGVLTSMALFGDHMNALYTSIAGTVDVF
jgi:Flp pilus assembly pilin Flp